MVTGVRVRRIAIFGMICILGTFSTDGLAARKPKPAHVVAGTGDDAAPAWTTSRGLKPPVKLRNFAISEFDYGKRKCGYRGVTRIWDPVNRRLLWIGGNCLSMNKGFAGNWQTADGKTWKKHVVTHPVLDPLRKRCEAARMPIRDGENAARNIFFSGTTPADEAKAVKGRPTRLLTEAVKEVGEIVKALSSAKAGGWQQEGVNRAKALATSALASLRKAQAGFSAGKVDAKLLENCFDGQWRLDEAADCLAVVPQEIAYPATAYDPESKSVVLFGGNHGGYVVNDTWIFDCKKNLWSHVWPETAPIPRCQARLSWDPQAKKMKLTGGKVPMTKFTQQRCLKPLSSKKVWHFDAKTRKWIGTGGKPAGSRTYVTTRPNRDPRWFDSEVKGSVEKTKKWHDSLKPNTWTKVPLPPGKRVMSSHSWGTSSYDPGRDLIFAWSGGHGSSVTDEVSVYHIATNRWSIGYVPEHIGWGTSFEGRPDCSHHTYKFCSYDPVSKKLVTIYGAGTAVYNPDRADWDYNFDHKFPTHIYQTASVGTPKGVYLWTRGRLRRFSEKDRRWISVKVKGRVPQPFTDQYAITYDPKRKLLWLMSGYGYKKKGIRTWKFDMATMSVNEIKAKQDKEIVGGVRHLRESVYIPEADLVVLNNFSGGKQVAFDPKNETWVRLNIKHLSSKQPGWNTLGRVGGCGLVYDTKRGLLWYLALYRRMFVLKVDPKTLKLSDAPPAKK
jgi:hypothetical protein